MLNTSFSPWPCYTEEEAQAVTRCLLSNRVNYWTGSECRDFEREFAEWIGTRYAVALSNGTLALEGALRAVGVVAGDDVVVTPRSFIASASCVVTVGGRPVFSDVDRQSQNITAASIERVLTPRTRAIVCVHLAGMPCDMDPIMRLASRYGLQVVEDCAQAHGARYKGAMVGSIGHAAAWSFCQDKIMTTGGEGGMVTTNDAAVWERLWSLKEHGKSWSSVHTQQHAPGYRWVHDSFGSNWRMLEMQAVIGRIQLRRIDEWHARRTAIAGRLRSILQQFPALRVPVVTEEYVHAFYRFYAFVEVGNLAKGWSRDRIVEEVTARGVPCYHGSCPEIYRERAFEGTASRPAERLPVAAELGETSLMFLVHPTITDEQMDRAELALNEVLGSASR
jgi:dTDP-4-amino-4,6-dideoxygalactose transaminase